MAHTPIQRVLLLIAVFGIAAPLLAQNPPPPKHAHPGQKSPNPAGNLLMLDQVQKELKITDQQKAQLMLMAMQSPSDAAGDPMKMLAKVLKPAQMKRLKEIRLQVEGPAALANPDVAKNLKLTSEQKGKLKQLLSRKMQESMQELQQLPPAEQQQKMAELQASLNQEALDLLTPEQLAKFEKMQGEKVDIDLSKALPPSPQPGK